MLYLPKLSLDNGTVIDSDRGLSVIPLEILMGKKLGEATLLIISFLVVDVLRVAGLGIYAYATREGAKKRDDPEELSRFASEVLVINLASTLLAYLGLAACLLFSSKLREYGPLIWTLSSSIIFTTLGCEWLYAIHEEYGYLALRNICFQILSLLLLLTYVKDESDLLLYAWTTVAGSAGANLINFLRLRKYCTWSLTWRFSWQKHPSN